MDNYYFMVSAFIISVKLDSCLACCSGSAKVHVACLRFLGLVTDYLLRVSLSLSIDYMTRQENNNTLLHDPINKRILRGPSSSATSSFKYLGKDLVDTFGSVVVSFFWFDQ